MQRWLYTAPVLIAILLWNPQVVFSTCDSDVNGSSGESISSEFKPPWDCYGTSSWFITAPLNHTIRLKFETFQLSDSQVFGQNLIQIYDVQKNN